MFDGIHGSFPPIRDQLSMEDSRFYSNLPGDYRAFLQQHNGGFVDEFRYTFLTGVPFKTEKIDNASRNDCPVEFYGFATVESRKDYPEDLLQVMVDHKSESFLPRDVIAIARCVQNSLVCLSLRPEDRGSMYYWDWYWRYPWCKAFFEERIERVTRNYTNPELILREENDPLHAQLYDELNFATLTRLAPSFTEWSALCEDQRNSPAE
jgi:SMI1-KNR4 cell-wall